MEAGDSSADLGTALMFDFDFDDHEISLDHQQNTTSMNFSNQENVEMGSSSDLLTVPANAHTNNEDLDSSLENTTNLAPQGPPSVHPDQVMGTEQAYNPTNESSEFQLSAKDNNQPQPHSQSQPQVVNLMNPSSDNVLSGHAHFSPESSNQQQFLANATNNLVPTITLSLSTPLLCVVAQSCFPTMEHTELGSSSGNKQSFLSISNSNQQAPNLIGSTHDSAGFVSIDTSLGNGTSVQQNQSAFLQSPLSETPQQYPSTTHNQVEMMPQFGGVPSFDPGHAINSNNSNQLSTCSKNSFQNELLSFQGMDLLNLPTTLRVDHQLAQNVENYYFLNNQQPALPCSTSFPQTSTGLGINSQVAQPPRNWSSNQNALCTPLTPSRPQAHQFLSPNVFDQHSANAMFPGSSLTLRPDHSTNNQQQLFNPVPVPAENVLNPQNQYSIMAEQSMFPRLQNLQSQSNQVFPFAPNYNVQEQQGGTNLMLSAPSMFLNTRPQQFPLHEQLNLSAGVPDLLSLPPAKSIQLKNSLLTGSRVLKHSPNDHPLLTLAQMMNTRPDNSFNLLNPPKPQTFNLQALMNQTTKPSFTFPTHTASSQRSSVFNSSTQRQSILGHRSTSTSPFELAEASSSSSSSSKRPRMSSFSFKDNASAASQARENEGDKFSLLTNPFNNNIARPGKNTLYDPLFEGVGLPIDPHLRLFNKSSNNNNDNDNLLVN